MVILFWEVKELRLSETCSLGIICLIKFWDMFSSLESNETMKFNWGIYCDMGAHGKPCYISTQYKHIMNSYLLTLSCCVLWTLYVETCNTVKNWTCSQTHTKTKLIFSMLLNLIRWCHFMTKSSTMAYILFKKKNSNRESDSWNCHSL